MLCTCFKQFRLYIYIYTYTNFTNKNILPQIYPTQQQTILLHYILRSFIQHISIVCLKKYKTRHLLKTVPKRYKTFVFKFYMYIILF